MEPTRKQLKVTKETINLRIEMDPNNVIWSGLTEPERKRQNMLKKPFSCQEGADLFGVSYKKFWRWTQPVESESLLPSKKKCPHCGISEYMRVQKWINDGTLDKLLKGVKE